MRQAAAQRHLKHYDLLATASVAVYLISQVASSKVISIAGLPFPGAILVFPAAFILSDIITEVYGYALARRIIWMSLFWATALAVTLLVVQFLPPAGGWPHQDAFARILGFVPRIVAASLLAYGVGEFINSYVLARMKVVTQGRHLWARTVGSTVAAQAVDTVVFVAAAFAFTLPVGTLILMSVNSFLAKVVYEALATPLVYRIVAWLKRSEGIDVYDRDTDFSPFRLGDDSGRRASGESHVRAAN